MNETIKRFYEQLGAIKALKYVKATADAANVLIFQQMKESKVYREIGYSNWEDFCKGELGVSYKTIDDAILNLKAFGVEMYDTAKQIGITGQQMKQLRGVSEEISVDEAAGIVRIGDESIPLTPAAAEELQDAIQALLSDKDRKLDQHTKTIESKDRLLEQKNSTLDELERENAELKDRDKYTPSETIQVLKQMESDFEVMAFRLDPESPQLDLDDRESRAAYGSLLFKLSQTAKALFDTADEVFGFGAGGWSPPEE